MMKKEKQKGEQKNPEFGNHRQQRLAVIRFTVILIALAFFLIALLIVLIRK